MPKAKKTLNRGEKPTIVSSSHRIGGRKSTQSAHNLTNADLLSAIQSPSRTRDLPSLKTVARSRGLEY